MMQEDLFFGSQSEGGSLLGSKPGSAIVKTGHLFGVFRIFVCLLRLGLAFNATENFNFV